MSSSDEEKIGRRKGNKLPRFQYPTFEDDGDAASGGESGAGEEDPGDDSSENDDNEFRNTRRPAMSHEERIYGVFYTEGMSSDDDAGGSKKRKRKKKPFFKAASQKSSHDMAPMFVKGDVLDPEKNDNDKEAHASRFPSDRKDEEGKDAEMGIAAAPHSDAHDEEDAKVELERKQRADKANQHFLELLQKSSAKRKSESRKSETAARQGEVSQPSLGRGLGFHSEAASDTVKEAGRPTEPLAFAAATSGIGFQSFGARSEGGATTREMESGVEKKLDPNLGKWEKHTKGIGAKLLGKMGYSGSGALGSKKRKKLGADNHNRNAAPIQVKVRPSNLGLGYGGFKEATHLNKQQEEKATKQREELKAAKAVSTQHSEQSAIPTVQDLLKEESWRATEDAGTSKTRNRGSAPKVVGYKELLAQQEKKAKGLIVDMRGPAAATTEESAGSSEPLLAEELLHNVSLLIGTYESKLYAAHQMESMTKQKLNSMKADAQALERQKKDLQERSDKMTRAIGILDEMEQLVASETDSGHFLAKTTSLVRRMAENFSPAERISLQFDQVILPSLLQPVLNRQLGEEAWNPAVFSIAESQSLIRSTLESLAPVFSLEQARDHKAMMPIWDKYILPRVQRFLEEGDWSIGKKVEQASEFYAMLVKVATDCQPSVEVGCKSTSGHEADHVLPLSYEDKQDPPLELVNLVRKQVIFNAVHPKLLRSMSTWKPDLDRSGRRLSNPLDGLVLPWLPHLDQQSFLPSLLQDCRSKVRSTLSFLQKNVQGMHYLEEAVRVVRSWRGILKARYMEEMVSVFITPKLSRAMAKQAFATDEGQQDWSLADLLFAMHSDGLVTDLEFLSIVEGELLNQWCHSALRLAHQSSAPGAKRVLANNYHQWRKHLLGSKDEGASSSCHDLLRNDLVVCQHFYSVLLMAQGSRLDPPVTNYKVVLARRTAEEKRKTAEELARMHTAGVAPGSRTGMDATQEARVRLAQRNHSHTPTFREIVAEFADERGILFRPKLGSNKVDGKQIFLFGSISVYLDSDVVYAVEGDGSWGPISLDELGSRALSKS